ncbi:HoxN/HupN/NixA family nickel/cobalt transporter [Laceyella sacchari]|uniref:Nickel/cobalt efflux system n=1 Tax=Laceyella sacchari TaxID=37482 RepID=A0ABY5U6E0_LACSH|nr:sodium:proton antiporter [Laceyella sacchari]UWE05203.1 sodium:proton antiporter [Laceyella sacchari]
MGEWSLFALVFALGLKHGLDADHLACIDGLTRYNWHKRNTMARWVGTFFSLGHGLVVTGVAVIIGVVSQMFTFPDYFDEVATWMSIITLLTIGTLNIFNLVKWTNKQEPFQPQGVKGKWIPRSLRETSNPFLIVLIGGVLALAADTVSQTSVWALAAGNSSEWMPLMLGVTFTVGMVITDTLDSVIIYRSLKGSDQTSKWVSLTMGWLIVLLAYGIGFYELFIYFKPQAELELEWLGVALFTVFLLFFLFIDWQKKDDVRRDETA